ncbi:hypothetical protein KKG72_10300 [bacterium]|nr:hypothetical protein [bacterium]MBU1994441.1 hypothetical protein [bacterium]
MKISSQNSIINIEGNIKSLADFQDIKNTIDATTEKYKDITININDSISVISSVIGYFNKLVLKDNINIKINVGSKKLSELFDDLNLTTIFKVKTL